MIGRPAAGFRGISGRADPRHFNRCRRRKTEAPCWVEVGPVRREQFSATYSLIHGDLQGKPGFLQAGCGFRGLLKVGFPRILWRFPWGAKQGILFKQQGVGQLQTGRFRPGAGMDNVAWPVCQSRPPMNVAERCRLPQRARLSSGTALGAQNALSAPGSVPKCRSYPAGQCGSTDVSSARQSCITASNTPISLKSPWNGPSFEPTIASPEHRSHPLPQRYRPPGGGSVGFEIPEEGIGSPAIPKSIDCDCPRECPRFACLALGSNRLN